MTGGLRAARRGLALLAVVWLGVAVSGAESAGGSSVLGGGGGAVDRGAVLGRAPQWPFRGIVAHWIGEDGRGGLEYWSGVTGEVVRVGLGRGLGDLDCLQPVRVGDGSVRVEAQDHRGVLASYGVPWGDEAYPLFPGRGIGGHRSSGEGMLGSYLQGRLEVSTAVEGFGLVRVASPEAEAIYEPVGTRREGVGLVLGAVPAHVLSEEEIRESQAGAPEFGLVGTDGFHYALGVYPPEPRCAADAGYLVAGDTGEVLACAKDYGAPLRGAAFVLPEGSRGILERFALPEPVAAGECGPFDLGALAPRPPQGGAQR